MNYDVFAILSLSVSGSILALILLICKPLLKKHVSKTFAYYIWALVLLRLIIPMAAPVNLVGTLFERALFSSSLHETTQLSDVYANTGSNAADYPTKQGTTPEDHSAAVTDVAASQGITNVSISAKSTLMYIWLGGFLLTAAWFITSYPVFVRKLRRSLAEPQADDLSVFYQMRGEYPLRMAYSDDISTPMLIGVFRPLIVLPQYYYVHGGMEGQLRNILRHELTHYRRKDVFLKWIVVAITSVHWFNPLMFLIRRELSRACELSCDEAVIRSMTPAERRDYGNTLISLASSGRFGSGILATTLSKEKSQLKERLMSICKYKKSAPKMIAISIVLGFLLAGCGVALGTVKTDGILYSKDRAVITDGTAYSRLMDGTLIDWHNRNNSYFLDADGNLILTYDDASERCRPPLTLSEDGPNGASINQCGLFLSSKITAVAYPNEESEITVLTSSDKGTNWNSSSIDTDAVAIDWISTGFTTEKNGWLVACSFAGMGSEMHFIYETNDGGLTWNYKNKVNSRVLSGSFFASEDIAYLCYRYEYIAQTSVYRSTDGGDNWYEINLPIPESYSRFNMTPLSPAFDNSKTVLPMLMTQDSTQVDMVYFISSDNGETWTFSETYPEIK